jgi:hypothetical protein
MPDREMVMENLEEELKTAKAISKFLGDPYYVNLVKSKMSSKEESKYYTPEIEEFHVGFEYEELDPDYQGQSDGKQWKPRKLSKEGLIDTLIHWKHIWDLVRVKYLDREDIESLGFELLKEDVNGKAFIHKDNDELQIWWSINDIIDIDNGQTYEDCITYFKGTIKNKSELKRILKQIGI